MSKNNVDWRLLGEGVVVQAIPKLVKKHGLEVSLPDERFLYGSSIERFTSMYGQYEAALQQLFEKFEISWKEVYLNSDVGKERMRLAEEMQIEASENVLDVGCGRGFFTIAAANRGKSVVGLDSMNGFGRVGWWKRFRTTMNEFHLDGIVCGVRGTVSAMPFLDEAFSTVASVHAMRNFLKIEIIQRAFKEMKRVTEAGGRMFIVETLPVARTKAQKAHLKMFECKVKYTQGDMPYLTKRQLTNLLEDAGFSSFKTKILDFDLSAAPPLFFPRISTLPEQQRGRAEEEYKEAVAEIREWGETSPPALLVEAVIE